MIKVSIRGMTIQSATRKKKSQLHNVTVYHKQVTESEQKMSCLLLLLPRTLIVTVKVK